MQPGPGGDGLAGHRVKTVEVLDMQAVGANPGELLRVPRAAHLCMHNIMFMYMYVYSNVQEGWGPEDFPKKKEWPAAVMVT